jgi:ankyrin repeat protein
MTSSLTAGRNFLGLLALCLGLFGILNPVLADSRPELFDAVLKGDLARAQAAINRGDDLNALYDRDTLLCWALRRKHPEMVRLILQSPKVDIHKRGFESDDKGGEWERSALLLAAYLGDADVVKTLLTQGADINDRDGARNTALLWSAARNHLNVARVLANNSKKPDFNALPREKLSSLWYAVVHENLEMVTLLHSKGANINPLDKEGDSVITETVTYKKFDVLDYLVANGADINRANNVGITPLMLATSMLGSDHRQQALAFIDKFLNFKPKIDLQIGGQGKVGMSALHMAATFGYTEGVERLLNNGANINLISLDDKSTPLHKAATGRRIDAVKLLLQRGAKTEIVDAGGLTPLLISVVQHDPKTVRALLEGGALPNTISSSGGQNTPLIFSASTINPLDHDDYVDIIKLLLDNKADINFPNGKGAVALVAAAGTSAHSQAYDKVRLLLERGANVNAVNNRGETALMLATGAGNEKVIKLLIDKGADPQLKNLAGETVMSYANRRGNSAVRMPR